MLKKSIFFIGCTLLMLLPVVLFAQGLVPECPDDNCGFADLIKLVNNVIRFLVVDITAPLSAIIFVYAGFLYLTAGGKQSQLDKAHALFSNVVIGLIIALSAFLVVQFILGAIVGDDVMQFIRGNFISG